MASSSSRGDRVIHQDYIARIRYSNALPPPPNPPKLLDIPNTGLASGQYTTPGFASRLARDQPLNIEADAELGMPLDLVGMPGVFDGDESSIQAPLHPPPVHPHDRSLLRPLSSLGKPKFAESGVSFLRRTEYISAYTFKMRSDSANARSLVRDPSNLKKRASKNVDKESPEYIQEQVEKSFEIAALALKDRSRVRHPSKRNVRLVESLPLIPDLDAFPDIGGYVTVKFLSNPVAQSTTYDKRLECGLLRPLSLTAEEERIKQEQQEAHERDPARNPAPEEKLNYEFFLPDTNETASNFKRKFDVFDDDHDDDALYTTTNGVGAKAFRFKRVRAYETSSIQGSADTKYSEEVVVALNDGRDGHHQKAAYYYPVLQRAAIRPQRNKNIARTRLYRSAQEQAEQEDIVDFIDVTIRDPDEAERSTRQAFKDDPYGQPEVEETEVQDAGNELDAEAELDARDDVGSASE